MSDAYHLQSETRALYQEYKLLVQSSSLTGRQGHRAQVTLMSCTLYIPGQGLASEEPVPKQQNERRWCTAVSLAKYPELFFSLLCMSVYKLWINFLWCRLCETGETNAIILHLSTVIRERWTHNLYNHGSVLSSITMKIKFKTNPHRVCRTVSKYELNFVSTPHSDMETQPQCRGD